MGMGPTCQQHNKKLLLTAETAAIHPTIAPYGSLEDIGPFPQIESRGLLNSIFYRTTNAVLPRSQSVLNAAARLITNTKKFDHITPVLRDQLHWLPIRQCIIFKIATFIRNSLHGRGPTYLSRFCIPISEIGARVHLCSAAQRHLTTPCTRTRRFGPKKPPCLRTGRVELSAWWHYKSRTDTGTFQDWIETHLFREAYA